MKFTGEVQVIPIGVGVSLRTQVKEAHRILEQSPMKAVLHGQGTNVEGELEELFEAIRGIHEKLHAEGTPRIVTNLKIGTRTDKEPSLAAKTANME